ncbi:MAG: carbohydrate ABC transporter permease [Anaerolineae bacterium]|nr:MAG: carbohydrate ABC transporter permease [Anaerolineae bacterium]
MIVELTLSRIRLKLGQIARPKIVPRKLARFPVHIALLVGGIIMILPFLWMLTTSLKPSSLMYSGPYIIPTHFEWVNYLEALRAAPFTRYYLNSIIMTAGITIGQVLFSSLAAYAFARLRFPGRDLLFLIFLGTMMIPIHVTLIPSFLVVKWLGWIDTYQALIVPRLVSAFGIFLLRQYYLSIPKELDEAALIDGASRLTVWWRIIIPLSRPALATLAIFSFLFAWNDFLWPLVVTNNPDMRTVQLGLAMFQGKYGTQWTLLMAGTVAATVPAIIAFLIGQRKFIQGITTTGIKG